MTQGHPIWFLLMWACVVWYGTVTLYVSVKGAQDVRQMLDDLKNRRPSEGDNESSQPASSDKTGNAKT